jgi:uncharacterized protein YcfL
MRQIKLLVILGAVALGGCYSLNTLQNADTAAQVHVVPDKRVSWDRTMEGKLHLGQIIDTTVTGLRKIQVDVTNRYAYHMDFAYKIEWFDASGMKIQGNDSWKRLHLEAHETSTISAIAETPKALDFIIKFQEGSGNNTIF